jgi:predicted transposase YdaD
MAFNQLEQLELLWVFGFVVDTRDSIERMYNIRRAKQYVLETELKLLRAL